MRLLLLALAACTPDPEPADDSALTDTGCAPLEIAVNGEPVPGSTLQLQATEDVTWTVSAGTVTPATGAEAAWSLPAALAVHGAETATVTAMVPESGCAPGTSDSVTVEADHPEGARVLLLYNPAMTGSQEVAEAYAGVRDVPGENLCAVETTTGTTLDGTDYEAFWSAVAACLEVAGPQVQFLVPVYGIPYRVSGRIEDIAGTGALATVSLDALLVFGAESTHLSGGVWNPLYQDGESLSATYDPYVPFGELSREWAEDEGFRLYLVTRLEGADPEGALALVDRIAEARELSEAASLAGTVYADARYGETPPATDEFGTYESGDWNMWGTVAVFEAAGVHPVVFDTNAEEFGTPPAPEDCPDALYYAGWYSYENYNDAFTWAPAAIGGHLDSCSACNLRGGASWSSGALERGITATFGAVNEPYVAGMPEYDQFYLYLLQGARLAEAAYQSTRVGAWMMTWVGDPLYQPYPDPPLPREAWDGAPARERAPRTAGLVPLGGISAQPLRPVSAPRSGAPPARRGPR